MNKPYHVIAKPAGAACNLDCTYCFYLEKENIYPSPHSNHRMPIQVAEALIEQKLSEDRTSQFFTWQGGEPTLMGIDYFRQIVEIQQRLGAGKKIENTLQTNGILLNDEWCQFLSENDFLVGISIDGPPHYHDKYRVDKGGHPTFKSVMRGIDFLNKYQVEFNTLTVVNDHNGDQPLEVYEFLKEIGSTYLQFIPIVDRYTPVGSSDTSVTPWSVRPKQFGEFLIEIFDYWVRNDVGKIFVQHFDVALEAWYGQPASLCVFNPVCGRSPALEHNGDLYSCDHYVHPDYRLGNITDKPLGDLVGSDKQLKFGRDKKDTLPAYCTNCDVKFVCQGGCPKNRFIHTPDGRPGLNYLCPAYHSFFRHIDPYMKYMVQELRYRRSPANVMEWIRQSSTNTD